MPVGSVGFTGRRESSSTSIVVPLPDIPADWAFWGEADDYAQGALLCLLSNNAPSSTPAGWTLTPGGYAVYSPQTKPARTGDIPPREDLGIRFYITDYGGGVPPADVTFNFGSATNCLALAMGTPQPGDGVSLLDPAGGPNPDAATPSLVTRVTAGVGIDYSINYSFTMRGTYAVGFWLSGTTNAAEAGNDWTYADSQPGNGDHAGDTVIGGLANIDINTGLPFAPGSTLTVDLSGTDEPESITSIYIFEFGAAGRRWWTGVAGWGG
jgi:hypothetical protein